MLLPTGKPKSRAYIVYNTVQWIMDYFLQRYLSVVRERYKLCTCVPSITFSYA